MRINKIGRKCQGLKTFAILTLACSAGTAAFASNLDTIGVTLLRTVTTNLNGSGVRVAQPEAGAPVFEVNPLAVGMPISLFTYTVAASTTNNYPNALGSESGHANTVASFFYAPAAGVATNVSHVDNYDANYFYNTLITAALPINSRIVNQSFSFGPLTVAQQQQVDSAYDNYAAQYNTLFVSAVANGGQVTAPGTSYNGIGVGAYGGATSTGPTIDNGRAKPDMTAPADVTSYSTAEVSGGAAILLQAGLRGDGGANTNSAVDARTLKALLLNGAVKPADWIRTNSSPLDTRYGAGILNVFNSYEQLAGGKHAFITGNSVSVGTAHSPTGAPGNVSGLQGWDLNAIASTAVSDAINHYYFNLTNSANNATFTTTATLVWNRQLSQSGINNLDLFLYNVGSGNLIAASTSAVDNVEHIFLTGLPPGRYDLQVLKHGGTTTTSPSETYALAFEFFAIPLTIAKSGTDAVLTWPVYPAGFVLESTASLDPPGIWSTVNVNPVITNSQNHVVLNDASGNQFFRLRRP
jgi:hypothetical protein